jgi:hypothetical protein
MNKTPSSKNSSFYLTIYFGLSKGEGEWPQLENLSPKETKDPRSFADFTLDLDEGGSSVDPKLIKSVKVLYDGITPLPAFEEGDQDYGISIQKDGVYGNIRPVFEFELKESVDPDEFLRLIWGSSYILSPQNSEEPFYAEDWNGYTEVLSPERKQYWVQHLKLHACYSGKVFKPSQLQMGISAQKLLGGPAKSRKGMEPS